MSTLFRSPNLKIDAHEWHVAVKMDRGERRPSVTYYFRTDDREAWQPLSTWPGRLPKGLKAFFQPYKRGIAVAIASVLPNTGMGKAA